MPNGPVNPDEEFPRQPGNYGTIHIVGPEDLPPDIKEALFGKMSFKDEGTAENGTPPPPKFIPVDTNDFLLLNNVGHWLQAVGVTGYNEDGSAIVAPVLGDKNRNRANQVIAKMLDRFEKHIELKNDGTL